MSRRASRQPASSSVIRIEYGLCLVAIIAAHPGLAWALIGKQTAYHLPSARPLHRNLFRQLHLGSPKIKPDTAARLSFARPQCQSDRLGLSHYEPEALATGLRRPSVAYAAARTRISNVAGVS